MRSWLVACLLVSGCDDAFDLVAVTPPDAAVPDMAPESGLVAHYPMDAVSGGTLEDVVGTRDGMCGLLDCPMATADVERGDVLAFDAPDQIRLPSIESPAGTVAIWFQPRTGTGYRCIVSKLLGTGANNTWQACMQGEALEFYSSGASVARLDTLTLQWHHLAIVWAPSGRLFYVDGVELTGSPVPLTFDGSPIVVGADVDNGAVVHHFEGTLDELRFYDRPLERAEIADLASP